jgi:DNA-binding LytR/AlgR family response regulator
MEDINFLELCGEAEHPLKADGILKTMPIDLILCDIEMPRMNGMEFVKLLKQPPMVVFTTAYPEYALQGYELDIIDYLLKPISFERFYKAMQKVQEFYQLKYPQQEVKEYNSIANRMVSGADYCFIKNDQQLEKIWFKDILFLEAMQNYVCIQLAGNRKILSYLTLSNMETALPENLFLKIHKSYIVSIQQVEKITSESVWIGSYELPISRSLKDGVLEKIVANKLIKRQ